MTAAPPDELAQPAGRRRRIVIASNRGPVSFSRDDDTDELQATRGGGGLVTALAGMTRHYDVTWVAHAMSESDVDAMEELAAADGAIAESMGDEGTGYRLRLAGEPDDDYDRYYHIVSNPMLWFIQHRLFGFGSEPTIDRNTYRAWHSYRDVNRRIADAVIDEVELASSEGDAPLVMVQDYQLLLAARHLRERFPWLPLQFFHHVPWPDPGAWRCLPSQWFEEVLRSLLSCDIIGLQTGRDVEAFLQCCARYAQHATVDVESATVTLPDGHGCRVRAYPISVAVEQFDELVELPRVVRLRERVARLRPIGGSLIVRVDRTDPSKNIIRALRAYDLLLREHPRLHRAVTMFCQLDPSRQAVPEYARYFAELTSVADRLNRRHGSDGWRPLVLNTDASFHAAVAAYCEYDVLFVNPVADGMNLVSKEGALVNQRDGVLVLSEQAGSYGELGEHAVGVNPFDIAGQADALHAAIEMPAPERARRAEALRQQVRGHDVRAWIEAQLRELEEHADLAAAGVAAAQAAP